MYKTTIRLKKPMPASNDCLPHAAMNLGAPRGVGLRPVPGVVSRIVIPQQVLPIGVVTALVGAPAFAIILYRARRAL